MCVALVNSQVTYVPLDGRPITKGASLGIDSHRSDGSLGLHRGDLYLCDGTVTRVSLRGGDVEHTDVPCTAVTADNDGIWVASLFDQNVTKYTDHKKLVAHESAGRFRNTYSSRIAIRGPELITAWHSTHELMVGAPGAPASSVALEGHDGWIMGLDRMANGDFVIGTWFDTGELRVFAADGRFQRAIPIAKGALIDGIVCGDAGELGIDACLPEPQPQPQPPTPTPNPEGVPCGPGKIVEMTMPISAENMAQGASDPSGAGYCTGLVEFSADLATWDASTWDSTKEPWVMINARANGSSVRLPGIYHSSTLVSASGKAEPHMCTIRALCEDGRARPVTFTW